MGEGGGGWWGLGVRCDVGVPLPQEDAEEGKESSMRDSADGGGRCGGREGAYGEGIPPTVFRCSFRWCGGESGGSRRNGKETPGKV